MMGKIGIIGGSALYEMEELDVKEKVKVLTPFGEPSDEITLGFIANKEVCFLPRHGKGHKILPSEINNKANIYALKKLGVDRILSISAVGSLKEDIRPLDIVLVDQFVDRTNHAREMTFFGDGIVAHIPFADPICSDLREKVYNCNRELDVKIHDGGTYLNMEGPAFSTKAESYLYKSWGMDVIGMTNLPEAKLSREAGICYVTIAMVTDYDCWYLGSDVESVSVDVIVDNLMRNIETAKRILVNTVKNLSDSRECLCKETLKDAILTDKKAIPEDVMKKLDIIVQDCID